MVPFIRRPRTVWEKRGLALVFLLIVVLLIEYSSKKESANTLHNKRRPHSRAITQVQFKGVSKPKDSGNKEKVWRGWDKLEYMFVFGDQYSTTFYDVKGDRPSPKNYLGNEDKYPLNAEEPQHFLRPNWVHYLASKHNETKLKVYDFAKRGAVVDHTISSIFKPVDLSVKDQMRKEFQLGLSTTVEGTILDWKAYNSLFTILAGTNDVLAFLGASEKMPMDGVIRSYRGMMDELYSSGAKNFLILNIPPIDHSPSQFSAQGLDHKRFWPGLTGMIENYNKMLRDAIKEFIKEHRDAAIFYFDLHDFMRSVLQKPAAYPETAEIQNTTDVCPFYSSALYELDAYNYECGVPVDEYFWQYPMHPTAPVHAAIAANIAKDCFSQAQQKGGFCS